jgi:hypothetical protein
LWEELVRGAITRIGVVLSDEWTASPKLWEEFVRLAEEARVNFGTYDMEIPPDWWLNVVWYEGGVELGGRSGSVSARFCRLDWPSSERGWYRCTIDVCAARICHSDSGLVVYDLRVRQKHNALVTVAAPAAQPEADSASHWTPRQPPPSGRYGHSDDIVALEVLTKDCGVILPIPSADLAAHQSRCPAMAANWLRKATHQTRMDGTGKFGRKKLRLRDALRRVLEANVQD